jgi:hypothetical protein
MTATTARRLAAAALVLAAIAAAVIALVVLPSTTSTPARAAQAPAAAAVVAEPVTPAQPAQALSDDDAAFLADLLGHGADATPAEALHLTELGRRYCALVVRGDTVPGAERQTRDGWLAGLTLPGPHALTASEAVKLLDTATAAYCPEGIAQAYPSAPVAPVPAPAAEQQQEAPAAPVVEAPAAVVVEEAPVPVVAEQLPEETTGRLIDCEDGTVAAVAADGSLSCPGMAGD